MHEQIQNAMTYVRNYGRLDLFVTMTCNPKWDKVQVEQNFKLIPIVTIYWQEFSDRASGAVVRVVATSFGSVGDETAGQFAEQLLKLGDGKLLPIQPLD